MKNLIFTITLILSINLCAQNEFKKNTNIFVRVYDLEGRKIAKGKILSISETSLHLYRKGESVKVMVNGIGSIKTKHSAGNNVLVGATTGATIMAILGAAVPPIFSLTAIDLAAAGVLVGGTAGAVIGGITNLFKNSKSYEINGDMEKWKAFKKMIIK